jgi:hypothetical protein
MVEDNEAASTQAAEATPVETMPDLNSSRAKVNLGKLSGQNVKSIRDDLVRAVVERAKAVETDAHSSHGNVHSSNSSAGPL